MKRKKYQVIFVLAADVEKKEGQNSYFFPEIDKKGLSMLGELRLKAAAKLFHDKAAERLVMVGGPQKIISGKSEEEIQKVKIMRERLVSYYKVEPKWIDEKQSEASTIGNAVAIKEYLSEHEIRPKSCAFLTNFFHIPRTFKIFADECDLYLNPIAAEAILFGIEEERKKILKIYSSPAMYARLGCELNGLLDWENGTYEKRK